MLVIGAEVNRARESRNVCVKEGERGSYGLVCSDHHSAQLCAPPQGKNPKEGGRGVGGLPVKGRKLGRAALSRLQR